MPPRREPQPLDLPNPTPPPPDPAHLTQRRRRRSPEKSNRTGGLESLQSEPPRPPAPIPSRPWPPSPLCALRRGPAAAQVEPTGTIASVIATSPAPHGGRGALPSAGGSPSDLLFLAGGGRDLRL
nr:unnamed protein product [Digitaria exilis]